MSSQTGITGIFAILIVGSLTGWAAVTVGEPTFKSTCPIGKERSNRLAETNLIGPVRRRAMAAVAKGRVYLRKGPDIPPAPPPTAH